MADAMDTLKNILGDDAEDKIKTVMNSLSSADNTSEGIDSSNGLNQIMQIKNIMDSMAVNKNDPRTNLLVKAVYAWGQKTFYWFGGKAFGAYKRNKNAEEIIWFWRWRDV